MVSDKYMAGFLDSDGCIAFQWKQGKYRPLLQVIFSQKMTQDRPVEMIHKQEGGYLYYNEINARKYTQLTFTGDKGVSFLNRLRKHLVIKRSYAEACLDIAERKKVVNLKLAKQYLKERRKMPSLPIPNFPSRKWLAGYIDGDGCLYSRIGYKGSCQINLGIACSWFDVEGIQLIQKSFGGSIRTMSQGNRVQQLIIGLPPSKALSMLSYFAKHLLIKRDQAYFVMGCARIGHYRNGKGIHAGLKQLKAREHRLSETDASIDDLLLAVRDEKNEDYIYRSYKRQSSIVELVEGY